LTLLAFVCTAVIVVWRRTRGVAEERAIAELDQQRRDLEAQRTLLESELREAMSAARIMPAAERRLGLRRATDSQLVTLTRRPAGASSVPDSP
jgi:hypothetical protein